MERQRTPILCAVGAGLLFTALITDGFIFVRRPETGAVLFVGELLVVRLVCMGLSALVWLSPEWLFGWGVSACFFDVLPPVLRGGIFSFPNRRKIVPILWINKGERREKLEKMTIFC